MRGNEQAGTMLAMIVTALLNGWCVKASWLWIQPQTMPF
jgi:hypothetical protein